MLFKGAFPLRKAGVALTVATIPLPPEHVATVAFLGGRWADQAAPRTLRPAGYTFGRPLLNRSAAGLIHAECVRWSK